MEVALPISERFTMEPTRIPATSARWLSCKRLWNGAIRGLVLQKQVSRERMSNYILQYLSVGCNYLFLPLIHVPASGTEVLNYRGDGDDDPANDADGKRSSDEQN